MKYVIYVPLVPYGIAKIMIVFTQVLQTRNNKKKSHMISRRASEKNHFTNFQRQGQSNFLLFTIKVIFLNKCHCKLCHFYFLKQINNIFV